MLRISIFILGLFSLSLSQAQGFTAAYDHTALAVSNLEESGRFYQDILNLEEITIPYENPILKWFSLGGPYQLHLIETDELANIPPIGTHLSLHVSDLKAFIAHLDSNNIPYRDWLGASQTVAVRPDGVHQVYVQDPDGYWIEINNVSH